MIDFDIIEWDEHNEEHVALNGVTPDEVEEVLSDPKNRPAVSRSTGRPSGRHRRDLDGQDAVRGLRRDG